MFGCSVPDYIAGTSLENLSEGRKLAERSCIRIYNGKLIIGFILYSGGFYIRRCVST